MGCGTKTRGRLTSNVLRPTSHVNVMSIDYVILCGGQGKRLRFVVSQVPKVLAPVGGKPFLDILIAYLQTQGAKRVILSTGYKADVIERHCRGRFQNLAIVFSHEKSPLGTGGAIKKACAMIRSKDFFVLNGDSFCRLDFKKLLAAHKKNNALATLAVSKVKGTKDYGTMTLGDAGRVLAFEEKTKGARNAYVNVGVYCFRRDIDTFMPRKNKFSIERDFFPNLVGKDFYGFVTTQKFIDIGTPQRYRQAGRYFIKSKKLEVGR